MLLPPKPPPDLKKSGKVFWRKIVATFELEDHHLELLRQAAKCLDDLRVAEKAVKDHGGRYFSDRYGQLKEHPAVADIRSLRGLFQRLCRELRLDDLPPESRPPR